MDIDSGAPCHSRALLDDRYKYAIYTMGRYREQLFDRKNDPGEMVNLAVNSRFGDVLDGYRSRLRSWCEKKNDPFKKMCA